MTRSVRAGSRQRPGLPFSVGILLVIVMAVGVARPALALPVVRVLPGEMMSIDVGGVSVSSGSAAWRITAPMRDDNGNASLPASFRRWWHFELDGLDATTGSTLELSVTRAGYGDTITPVWSLDGGRTYQRIPGVVPVPGPQSHTFTVRTPPGTSSVRLAKYFPYTLADFERFRQSIAGHPFLQEETIGRSQQGRDIVMHTLTDPTVADSGKRRVWIHAGVHPAETPAHFTAEGFVGWLTGGSSEAQKLLGGTIINVVTMANPDGVSLGNYRTNAASVNLETQWAAPYLSSVPEIVALRRTIEGFMGTSAAPGSNPITMLLNLHASHGGGYPFHYVHQAGYPAAGVTAEVRGLEERWIAAFKGRSQFGALRTSDPQSTLSGRSYVESMMHDRYTLQPDRDPVMAITFEGTYELGPRPGIPNTPDDYRRLGGEMAMAIADYHGIDLTAGPISITVPDGRSLSQAATGHPLISGTHPVVKSGGGTLVFESHNLNRGAVIIDEGILVVANGRSLALASLVALEDNARMDVLALEGGFTVPFGQTLAGSGTVLGSIRFGAGSTLSPGGGRDGAVQQAVVSVVPEPVVAGWAAFAGLTLGSASRIVARRGRGRSGVTTVS